ncbi:hypothetical protein BH23PLA1_BH23PLA1_31870 [soil metagenome]
MPSPALAMTLIALLGALLAVVSIAAAWLWQQRRDSEAAVRRWSEALEVRLRSLESAIRRLEDIGGLEVRSTEPFLRPLKEDRSARSGRVDPAQPLASSGPSPTLIAVPDLAGRAPGGVGFSAASTELGRRFGTVWELAEAGASAEAIARATGQQIGRVELILNLRRQWLALEDRV